MIKNERQYRITKAQAARFTQTLDRFERRSGNAADVHPRIAKAQEEAVRSQLADLNGELREYESLKAEGFQLDELNLVTELAAALIKARIRLGLSQKQLAARIGLKEQQIQRYEATDYESASLARIKEIVSALDSESGKLSLNTGAR